MGHAEAQTLTQSIFILQQFEYRKAYNNLKIESLIGFNLLCYADWKTPNNMNPYDSLGNTILYNCIVSSNTQQTVTHVPHKCMSHISKLSHIS